MLPGADFSYALAVSNSTNQVVVGQSGVYGFRWTQAEGMEALGGSFEYSSASDVSADGSLIVGSHAYTAPDAEGNLVFSERPCLWRSGQLVNLPMLPPAEGLPGWGIAHGVSADGSVIVGECQDSELQIVACVWHDGAITKLPGVYGLALAVSSRGDTVVGVIGGLGGIGFRWTDHLEFLGPGSVYGVTADGNTVVGEAGRWTVDGGWYDFGEEGVAYDISDQGCVIVGGDPEGGGFAGIWTPWTGAVELQTWIQEKYGPDLGPWEGWDLDYGYGISGDGRAVVGQGVNESGQVEAFLYVSPPEGERDDFDEDGISDLWECAGIDVDRDGIVDIDLPAMGADPAHKDLFIEMDLTSSVSFLPEAKQMVQDVFAAAPVLNPDGTTGIQLHIRVDEGDLPSAALWPTDTNDWPIFFDAWKKDHFGTEKERNRRDVVETKKRVFRYCLGIDSLARPAGGVGEIGGNDFVLALGLSFFSDGLDDVAEQASVFMHELGHNLGLRHGGTNNINGKPNYVSVMNYVVSYPQRFSRYFWRLDYSRERLPTLDEASLDENAGIPSSGPYTRYWMPYGYNMTNAIGEVLRGDPLGPIRLTVKVLQLDGRSADFGRLVPANDGVLDGIYDSSGVRQDLNYLGPSSPIKGTSAPSPDEVLTGWDDWANIQIPIPYPFTGDYADASHVNVPHDELTQADREWIDEYFPDAPEECSLVLEVLRTGDSDVTIQWTAACDGVLLQRSTSLKSTDWQDVAVPQGQHSISLSPSAGSQSFYRLIRPAL